MSLQVQTLLVSSDSQFGFKKRTGFNFAIRLQFAKSLTVISKEAIQRIFVPLTNDLSKAFDKL